MLEDAIAEAAFQIYRRFTRERDQHRARQRFANLKDSARQEWLDEAKAVWRVFETYTDA